SQGVPDAAPDAAPLCTQNDCDDQNMCTIDTCVPSTGCMHATNTCDMMTGCKHDLPHGSMVFMAVGSIVPFTVPTCVTSLHVVAAGAQGGNAQTTTGGMGETMEGDFAVVPGTVLDVLVGLKGTDYNPNPAVSQYAQRGGTGGGGTFVVAGTTVLVVAGGGGGASGLNGVGVAPGGPGQTTVAGQSSPGGGTGGTNGGGGGTISNAGGFQVGTGGGGYSGNGIGASDGDSSYGTPNQPGTAYINGGAGGVGGSQGRNGGFGGGGAAGATGGGGGGYSGGGAGSLTGTTLAGGGGGSINNGTNPVNTSGNHAGDGQVTITW
ncbi:MAG TPA: hypothetical protein VLT45_07740, partial [Kofleriaceae bacterium]|nr:hypothetical protein [Kofleriaceae bacterium]